MCNVGTKLRDRIGRELKQRLDARVVRLGLLGGGDLDEDSWESIEDTLLIADEARALALAGIIYMLVRPYKEATTLKA